MPAKQALIDLKALTPIDKQSLEDFLETCDQTLFKGLLESPSFTHKQCLQEYYDAQLLHTYKINRLLQSFLNNLKDETCSDWDTPSAWEAVRLEVDKECTHGTTVASEKLKTLPEQEQQMDSLFKKLLALLDCLTIPSLIPSLS